MTRGPLPCSVISATSQGKKVLRKRPAKTACGLAFFRPLPITHTRQISNRLGRPSPVGQRDDRVGTHFQRIMMRFMIESRQVPAEHHIAELQQRTGCRQWFDFKNVESRTTQMAGFQGAYQSRLIHQQTTRCIDQHRTRLHPGKRLVVHGVLGLGTHRQMQRDVIRLRQQIVE